MEIRTKKCPMCGVKYDTPPAISRTAGKEEICSACGAKQALEQWKLVNARTYQTREVARWTGYEADEAFEFVQSCLQRHWCLDWGDMCTEDKHANDIGLTSGDRLFSSYNIPTDLQANISDDKIWIITEWDRSATTILFPSEY